MSESMNQPIHDPILSIRNLSVVYKDSRFSFHKPLFSRPAVDGFSLDLPPHKTIGIVGESGCGKSTIAKSILMMTEPCGGEIFFNETSLDAWKRNRLAFYSQVQMIWQDPFSSINPKMRVQEIISRPLRNFFHLSPDEIAHRLHATIKKAGLTEDHLVMYPHELSGGGRQRVTIARALISEPVLLIADEPTSALDVSIQAQILNLLKALRQDMSLSMIFISHNISVVEFLCDTICVMYMGRIVESAPREALVKDHRHWYTTLLFESLPTGPQPKERKFKVDLGELAVCEKGCAFAPRCIRAEKLCYEVRPDLIEIGPGHQCACHFHA